MPESAADEKPKREVPADVTVYHVKNRNAGRRKRLHLHRGCSMLKQVEDRDKIKEELRGEKPRFKLCSRCTGLWTGNAKGEQDKRRSTLIDADPGDWPKDGSANVG